MILTNKFSYYFILFFFGLFISFQDVDAQSEIIYLENPSFEDEPRAGWQPNSWIDCGFPGESAPDVQPYGGFGVTQPAQNQNTYLGLVVRDNKTWECVSQRLSRPLRKGQCYKFSIYLSRSNQYVSPTKKNRNRLTNFEKGTVLRIYGGTGPRERTELLATSEVVNHTEWKQYKFELNPAITDYDYFFLEVYYKTPTMFYYNGNLLLDNASEIYSCTVSDPKNSIAENTSTRKSTNPKSPKSPNRSLVPSVPKKVPSSVEENRGNFSPKMNMKDLKVGYIFRLDNLHFKADSFNITTNASRVLLELVHFLKINSKISIEVGGHTNGRPLHAYCDRLSSDRAENVAHFLTLNGIDRRRITHKGYGKRKPITDNDTDEGRRLNQRVEIKITALK